VLWWLLRLVPPRPRRQMWGPEKLLLDIVPKEETPARTPWWRCCCPCSAPPF